MSRRKNQHGPNHERWLVSYADFITMMFALFVVLYSTAQSDHKHRAELAVAIQAAFQRLELFPPAAKLPLSDQPAGPGPAPALMAAQPAAELHTRVAGEPIGLLELKKQLEKRLAAEIRQQTVALNLSRDGLVISLREVGFFESGSAAPRPGSAASLQAIAATLAPIANDLRIEGHTDNMPIQNQQFASNWELSAARATSIARAMIEQYRFAPARIAVAGYAQYHPIASNQSEPGRALNRRVDLVVLPASR